MTDADAPGAARVTVAVPTRNRAAFLRQCVESVRRQTHADLEILIGDNASTDETGVVAQEMARADGRIRYVRHAENLGMVGNWNALLRAATGRCHTRRGCRPGGGARSAGPRDAHGGEAGARRQSASAVCRRRPDQFASP